MPQARTRTDNHFDNYTFLISTTFHNNPTQNRYVLNIVAEYKTSIKITTNTTGTIGTVWRKKTSVYAFA